MARFYGRVQGGRGEATRLGHAKSGLNVSAHTWGESFHVQLWAGEDEYQRKAGNEKNMGSVHLGSFCLFIGDMEQLKTQEGKVKWLADILKASKPFRAAVLHELAMRGLMESVGE